MAVQGSGYSALVVDDDPNIRRTVSRALRGIGFSCDTAPDGEVARQKLVTQRVDLLVADLRMPVRHGHRLVVETLERKSAPVVVVITGLVEPAIVSDLVMRGVADFVSKPFDARVYAVKWLALLKYREGHPAPPPATPAPGKASPETPSGSAAPVADQDTVARQLGETADALRKQLSEITGSFEATIQDLERKQENLSAGFIGSVRLLTQLMRKVDGAEESTHAARVERLAEGICDRLQVTRDQVRNIRLAALLHDLGQFGMPDAVRLLPPERMNAKQLEAYKRYPEIGATLLSEVQGCEQVVDIVMAHTEHFEIGRAHV